MCQYQLRASIVTKESNFKEQTISLPKENIIKRCCVGKIGLEHLKLKDGTLLIT